MKFGVLGPFEVIDAGGLVAVGGPKERALLAALVLRANAVVTASQLVTDLWGEDPPRSAAKTIQTYVSHVRRALPDAVIETAGAGYRLAVGADEVDALRFEQFVADGRAALRGGDAKQAARILEAALALWRGEPLAEFEDAAFASAEATRLSELRLTAIEDRVEAGLALGEARHLVGELQRLVRAHPLRELLWGQLMLALYRSGRQADALAAYQRARRHLVDEIGVEPGEDLRALERALLEQDPTLRDTRLHGTDRPESAPLPARLRRMMSTPFVGRDNEWQAARSAWTRTVAGNGAVLLISGEAGIGKSRLAEELARHAYSADGAQVLYGACVDGLAMAYQPIADAVAEVVATVDLDPLDAHLEAFGGELARVVPALTRRVPDLPEPLRLDPEAERLRQLEAVAGAITLFAVTKPLLLLIDDVQWASQATLQMLGHIVRQSATVPVLVALTFRDEVQPASPLAAFLADVQRGESATRIALEGLDHDGVSSFVAGSSVSVHEVDDLLAQTGGNPFFLGELVRHLVSGGVPSRLPASVAEVLGFRLDRLDTAANHVLRVAAIAGEHVDRTVLERAVGSELLPPLEACLDARVLTEVPGGVTFPHALVRRAVLARLSEARSEVMHAAVAKAISEVHVNDLDAHAATLAGHWAAAGPAHLVDVAESALRGAAHAQERMASEETFELVDLGLDALANVVRSDATDVLHADLLLARAIASGDVGDIPALRDAAWAAAAIGRTLPPALGAVRMGRAAVAMTSHIQFVTDDAERTLTEAAIACLTPHEPVLRARLLADRAFLYALRGSPLAADMVDEALNAAHASGDVQTLVWALYRGHTAFQGTGRTDEMLAMGREAQRLGPGLGNRIVAGAKLEEGDLPAIKASIECLRRFGEDSHSWYDTNCAAFTSAVLAHIAGDFACAEELTNSLMALGGRDPTSLAVVLGQTAHVRWDQGRFDEALSLFAVVNEQLNAPGVAAIVAQVRWERDGPGDREAARALLAEFSTKLASLPVDLLRPALLATLTFVAAGARDRGAGARLEPQLVPFAGKMLLLAGGIGLLGAADRYRGMCASLRGDHEEAIALLEAAERLEAGMDGYTLLCRTRLEHARVLLSRSRPGDLDAAHTIAAKVAEDAERFGMMVVARDARHLLGT